MMRPSTHQFSGIDNFVEHAYSAGLTDGLPVLPPEPDVIDDMLDTDGADAATSLCRSIDPDVTVLEAAVLDIAVTAGLAGCLPSYFPVVVAAVEAFFDGGLHDSLAARLAAGRTRGAWRSKAGSRRAAAGCPGRKASSS